MSEIINIKQINGVWTNADQSDIPDNFATTLQNFKSLNGKLVKTFGFGNIFEVDVLDIIETSYWVDSGHVWDDGQYWVDSGSSIDAPLDEAIINLITFFNSHATTGSGSGSGDGYVIIGVVINSTTSAVTLYYWTGVDWENITSLIQNTPSTYYHVYGKNPIIQSNEIIRFLPGCAGQVGTGNTDAIGIWLGWIDRDYFDGLYEHKTDYDQGFYLLDTYPERPDISSDGLNATTEIRSGGTYENNVERYYKLSYVYDGINESLLSEEIKVAFTANTFLELQLVFNTATFNKRITALNVYRSETGDIGEAVNEINSSYEKIHTIDLTRDPANITGYSGTQANSGLYYIYIPDLKDGLSLTESQYWVRLNEDENDWYRLYAPTETNQKLFLVLGKYRRIIPLMSYIGLTVDEDYNGVDGLFVYGNPAGSHTHFHNHCTCYGGNKFAFLDDAFFSDGVLKSSIIIINVSGTKYYRVIETNNIKYVRYSTAIAGFNIGDYDWQIISVNKGLYYFSQSGTKITCYFFDTELTKGAAYPLLNEPAITVNAEFAVEHLGRLWQFGHCVLDPGGKNEEHHDWLMYSEIDQYDVQPVSNAIRISDLTGGKGMGLATSFGSLILLKQNSVHKLKISDISDPTTWYLSESVFNRGCVARQGYIQIGHKVYFCASDGIYELDVNFEAATDDTPLIQNRISEPINDVYLALNDISEKPYIRCGYDKINTEIIFRLTSTAIWAFNILTKGWRQIDTDTTCDIFAYDQNDNLMQFDSTTNQLYSIAAPTDESVGCCVATKFFDISGGEGQRKGLVRSVTIRYKSEVPLLVRFYTDDSDDFAIDDEMAPELTQANWDTVEGWDLSGTSLNHNANGTGTISPLTSLAPVAGDIYKVVITLSACTAGSCTYTLGGTAGTILSSGTTYTDYIIATNSNDLIFTPSDANARFNISAVSVKKVTGRSLPISADILTAKFAVRARANRFKLEILDLTKSISKTEIHNINIEVE